MLAKFARRSIYCKKAPGHEAYKAAHLSKIRKRLSPVNDLDDPLSPNMMPKHIKDRGNVIPGEKITADYLLAHPTLGLSSTAIGYLAYRCSRFPEHNTILWDILEYHLGKKLENMNPRLLYGCYYGFLRTGLGSQLSFSLLHREFMKKAWPLVNPFECYELLEASSFLARKDYDSTKFSVEEVIPKLNHFWKRASFVHSYDHCKNLIDCLYKMNLFTETPELWTNVLDVLSRKKHFATIQDWAKFYDLVLYLRQSGFEAKSGNKLDPLIEHFHTFWESNTNYQWRYCLEKNRFYTASEMVEKTDQGGKELKWEDAEKYIAHHLPQWYLDGNKELEEDVSLMLEEYYATRGEFALKFRKSGDMTNEDPEDKKDEDEEEEEIPEEEVEDVSAPAPKAPAKSAASQGKKGKKKAKEEEE